jgi:hypothetical protein
VQIFTWLPVPNIYLMAWVWSVETLKIFSSETTSPNDL